MRFHAFDFHKHWPARSSVDVSFIAPSLEPALTVPLLFGSAPRITCSPFVCLQSKSNSTKPVYE
jgi:hypothetical protein